MKESKIQDAIPVVRVILQVSPSCIDAEHAGEGGANWVHIDSKIALWRLLYARIDVRSDRYYKFETFESFAMKTMALCSIENEFHTTQVIP